jgi:lipopolysaccharide cholinephosphotransferase
MKIARGILQSELLKIMKTFHEVCVKHNLKYYMLGGTCLGAIRHKGFIPWDDDMDVGMPRKDYDIFCKKWAEMLPNPLEVRYYRTEKKSPFHFIKLINRDTTLIEHNFRNYVEGIYIDVFPLDALDEYKSFDYLRTQIIWVLGTTLIYHCMTTKKKRLSQILFKNIARCIPLRWLHNVEEFLMTMNKKDSPKLLCNFLGAWRKKELVPADFFGNPVLYQFEDAAFYGPENADEYLKSLYGNYMQPPPEKEREAGHDYFYVNLNQPYRNYLKKV